MVLVLLIILILILLGAIPRTGAYNEGWSYGPSGIVGIILIIVVILLLTGHIPAF